MVTDCPTVKCESAGHPGLAGQRENPRRQSTCAGRATLHGRPAAGNARWRRRPCALNVLDRFALAAAVLESQGMEARERRRSRVARLGGPHAGTTGLRSAHGIAPRAEIVL